MFPPNYDQIKFEEHVESHWKVCPMCSEQFPPDYDQQGFERHVQTHFDQNVLNFDQFLVRGSKIQQLKKQPKTQIEAKETAGLMP